MKTIVVGVTSSIASFKAIQLVSDLVKGNYDVEVILTKNACEMVTPLSFSALTKHKTYVETFDRYVEYDIKHISLAKKADLMIIIPATANMIAKVTHGIADDMLSTTFLACDCPKIICPAMNSKMYLNPVIQDNLTLAKHYGYHIVEPVVGHLACGDNGVGKLADLDTIKKVIKEELQVEKNLKSKKILISAGPTIEAIDPVRFISNHSSGKMGYALANAAKDLGAEVYLVSGPVNLQAEEGINLYEVTSAQTMHDQILKLYPEMDYVVMAAAVADYRVANYVTQKIKKDTDNLTLELVKNPDILAELGEKKAHQKICGFAMETENVLENAKEKMLKKHCDMLVVNDLNTTGAGFKVDTNVATILTPDKQMSLPMMSKYELAEIILKQLNEM